MKVVLPVVSTAAFANLTEGQPALNTQRKIFLSIFHVQINFKPTGCI
jgi:hypothetical protein